MTLATQGSPDLAANRSTEVVGRGCDSVRYRRGAILDDVALQRLLRWHHLVTSTCDYIDDAAWGLEQNRFADGLFDRRIRVCPI